MRMTEQELEAYIRQYTELEKECMKSRFPEKFSNEEFWNQRSREKDGYILESRQFMKPEDKIVVARQDRFNKVRAHKHDYIELCYVWSGICYQTIEGKAVTTEKGDVCIFDTHAVHSIESAGEDDILVNILMRREFFDTAFLSRMTVKGIVSEFLVDAVTESRKKEHYLYFPSQKNPKVHELMKNIMVEYFSQDIGTENTDDTNTVSVQTENTEASGTAAQKSGETSSDGQVVPGTNKYDAGDIPFNTKISGTATEGVYNWYAFTTGPAAGTEYKITCVNTTPGADSIHYSLYDEYGSLITFNGFTALEACSDGVPSTMATNELDPNTTYYLQLITYDADPVDYILNVTDPNTPAPTSVPDSQNTLPPDGEVIAGTSQYNALLLPLNTKVFGTAEKDSYSWFSFNTGDSSGDEFRITAINNTPGADSIHYSLYDEYGSLITSNGFTALEACSDGVPSTMVTNELDSNTTYYLKLITYGADPIDYSLIVKNMNNNNSAYKTAGNVIEAKGAEEITEGPVTAGTSPDNALLLPIGSKVSGTAEESTCSWFGFKTGETTGTEYTISCINTTPGADSIHYSLYDEYGSLITFNGFTALEACSDGVPSTMVTNELNPNTTYYLKLITYDANPIDYILDIQAPVKEDPKGSLVFEVPFEINETQVQFVINEATFIDEEKAKEIAESVVYTR